MESIRSVITITALIAALVIAGSLLVDEGPSWALLYLASSVAAQLVLLIILDGKRVRRERELMPFSNATTSTWRTEKLMAGSATTEALEALVRQAYRQLDAEAVELALESTERGGFHSSIVVGNPLYEPPRSGSRIRALGSSKWVEQPLMFAGTPLGILRVRFKASWIVTRWDREFLEHLALECVLVLLNARMSSEERSAPQGADEAKIRSEFLANLSHELRGPLGIILNASELVLEGLCGPINPDQDETLGMVRLNSQHLMELITDVLDFARVESGKLTPRHEKLSLTDQLLELTKMVRAHADSKSHSLRCREVLDSHSVWCDKRHFRQIMLNLLTNAIKYTPDNGAIEVWAEPIGDGVLRVCVRDSGVGIRAADRSKVFAPFERIDDPYSSTQLGTGLGLSLSNKLAVLNGGRIDFVSTHQKGTTFWVELPLPDSAAASGDAHPPEPADGNGNLILMVQPGPEERVLIARYLRSVHFRVEIVAGEEAARAALERNDVALVLLSDEFRPARAGPLAEFVRQASKRHVPVVLLTRNAFLVDVERYLREEVDVCLAKPVKLAELAHAARRAIDLTSALRGGVRMRE